MGSRSSPTTSLGFALLSAWVSVAEAQTVSNYVGAQAAFGLAVDASGRLYVSTRSINVNGATVSPRVLRCTPPSTTAEVFASTGLVEPRGMVFDDSGNLLVADYSAGKVLKITPSQTVSTFALVPNPSSIVRDADGNLFVGSYVSKSIHKITPAGVVSTYVAQAWPTSERLSMLFMDDDGTLYAGDNPVGMSSGKIVKIAPGGSPTTPFASGLGATFSMIRGPLGGFLLVTYDFNTIRAMDETGTHTLYSGATEVAGLTNGALLDARYWYPTSLIHAAPYLYVAEWGNNRIRKIDFSGVVAAERTSWGRLKALYR